VPLLGQGPNAGRLGASVVAAKNEKCVFDLANPFQGLLDFPHDIVRLHHEIAVLAEAALPLPLGRGQDWGVG